VNRAQTVVAAANKWHVPPGILAGVWGAESGFGENSTTSTGGAIGDFQFIPSTARQYNYPLVNNPDNTTFARQADAAAHYLSTLHKETGDWNSALQRYSGGGYGLSHVENEAKSYDGQRGRPRASNMENASFLGDLASPFKDFGDAIAGVAGKAAGAIGGAAKNAASAITGPLGSIVSFVRDLLDPHTWFNVGKVIFGAILTLIGLFKVLRLT
jgi:hypothetical protein